MDPIMYSRQEDDFSVGQPHNDENMDLRNLNTISNDEDFILKDILPSGSDDSPKDVRQLGLEREEEEKKVDEEAAAAVAAAMAMATSMDKDANRSRAVVQRQHPVEEDNDHFADKNDMINLYATPNPYTTLGQQEQEEEEPAAQKVSSPRMAVSPRAKPVQNLPTPNYDGMLSCDYEENPTTLYTCIQQADWLGVKYQAENFGEEAQTLVCRKFKNGTLKWRLLPLHAAILMDAPFDVVKSLLDAFPGGAQVQDDQGMLPVHLAIRKHANEDTINVLLATYPDCVDIPNGDGHIPYQMAEKSSSAHRAYYLRALQRGPTHSAVTASFSDLFCGCGI